MSISNRGSSTSGGDDATLGGNTVGDQFNRLEAGIGAPADEMSDRAPEAGISAPEVGIIAPVIGITAPADEIVPPVDAPAGNNMITDASGDLSALGTWESVVTLAVVDDNDEPTNQKGGRAGFDPNAANIPGNPGQLLTIGTNPDGSHFFTGNRNVDATLIGSKWGTTNLTYSFPTNASNYNGYVPVYDGVGNYHVVLGTQQQAAARAAFAQLSAVSGLTFTEITETDTVHANIRISQTADADVPSAYGTFPSDFKAAAGDIWFGRNNQPYYDMAYKGTWGFATIMHEIGHTMGLKHGHQDYTNLDLSSSFGTSPRYGSQSLTPDRDGQAWSLMTYTPAPFTNSNFAGEKINQPQTYMQYDVAALQYLYGANFNTNNGDSVYTFSQTTGEMFINGVGQGAPSGNKIFLTIWDGGGNDTIDASNYANGVTIDLRPGEFSTFDQNQLANNLAYQNLVNLAPGNIAMSLLYNNDSRSLIENATGGAGNDIFVGNTANNILDGSAGSDTAVFTNPTGVNVTLNDTNTDVIVSHDGETDTLRSIENIVGTSGNDTITGNSQDNRLNGSSGGADVLTGNDGNDTLIGGGFTTTTTYSAPSQPDITKPQTTNNGSIATAVATAGFYDVDANPNITNATFMPHATINATAFGGAVEYYRIDVTVAGSTAIFDIDGNGTLDDSILELVNSSGTVLASNDTGTGDASPPGHDDAYLTFTFATVGTYYIRVGRFISNSTAQPLIAGQTYQLNISLDNSAAVITTVTANNTSSLVADGGAGDDLVVGTLADDTLTGGSDNDTAVFVNAFSGGSTTGVTVDLNLQGGAQNTVAAGNDTLTGFENLIGSALNDTLTGDGNDNVIEGYLGNDTLAGGLGNDTASYANAAAGVTVSLALQGSAQNTVNAGTDTLSGFENLAGSAFADTLTGDANTNTLSGGAGDDTLNPGANPGGTVDLLDGGLGSDTASFAGNASAVTATLNGVTDGTATVGGLAIATLRSIENLTGSANADTLTGDANANVIEGGLGNDILDGGLGVDTVAFSGATAVTVNLATLTATGLGSDTITNFENVRTGSGNDSVTGDSNDNIFFDGGGNDTYDGDGGTGDTLDYSAATSTVTVNLGTPTAQNTGTSGGTDTITNIENIVGAAAFANTLTGSTLANRMTGGSAADVIQGLNGADVIFGGAGNDTLLGGTSGALDDGSADTLEGGAGADFLGGGQGNDIVRGGDGDDVLVGGVVNTSNQFFTGVDGGDDTYDGGDGSDRAIMVYDTRAGVGASTVGIAFDIANLAGNSNITWNGVVVGSMTSIEFVTFRGSNVNDTVKGGGSLDSLTGGAGDDVLDGWYGNDLLSGGLGNDTLIGGEGLDTVTYANSTAGVNVDLRIQGVAQNTGGEGVDTLIGIEYLVGSNFADTLRGDDNFNLITDGTISFVGQTDSLFGYGGNDSILVTRNQGATSTVNMDGGDGDDFIELRSGTLSVALATNLDGLVASPTGASQTYMALGTTGSGAAANLDVVTVDGGAGNDRIILSGVASATVSAGSGNDTVSISMRGAAGVNNYALTLGAGADIVPFGVGSNAANSTDVAVSNRTSHVTDFDRGDSGDKFEMTNFLNFGLTGYTANSNAFADGHLRLLQSGANLLLQVDRDGAGATNGFVTVMTLDGGYTGGFTAFNFDGFIGSLNLTGIGALNETLTGATAADTLSGGDGNDVLIGLGGADTLNGGNGDDTVTGGTGNDALNGGSGTDTATYSGPRSGYTFTLAADASGHATSFASVTDTNAGNGDEGADTLTSIEKLSFSDQTIDLTQLVQLFDASNNLVGTFGTIQAAVNASSDGYRISVGAGTYNENVSVNKDITIDGPNMGIAGNGARGAEAVVNGLFSLLADGITLSGLKITGAPLFGQDITAIFANNKNATLTNLILDGPGNGYGIQTTYNGGVTGLVLSNSLVTHWGAGTYFNPTTGFTATGNSFANNGNDLLGDGWAAGSFIDNNSFANSQGSHIGYGTYLSVEDMRNFVGTGNSFSGTGSRAVGIFAYGDGTPGGQDVTGTEYADGFFGSEFVAGSGDDSTFHGLGGNDSMLGGSGNDIFDGGSGIDTSSYGGVSTIHETATGWTVTTATEGTDTLANVEIVDDVSSGVIRLVGHGGYATIQAAIDASNDGDTIVVASGTWTENLLVNKDVTILGVNNHGADANGARGAESVIDGQIIVTAAGATLDGFKLIGDAPGSLGNTALEVQASNFTLANTIMAGDGDVAIIVFAGTTGLDVGHNRISGYSIGAYVGGGTTAGSIHDNRFQGDGGPSTGLGNGVNSESSHVAIANNAFDGIYAATLNIFPYGPDTVDLQSYITGNTITNSGIARPVQIQPTDFTHNILGTDFNEAFIGDNGVVGPLSFDGRGGADKAWGSEQGDTLSGGAGDDELYGNGGDDTLNGGDNNDLIVGGAGADHADGGNGNDTVSGDSGNDVLAGGAGTDTLNGGDDDDSLDGGSGVDTLNGDNGNDTLHGGAGNDALNGGSGTDTAVYDGNRGDYSIGMITGAGGRIVGFSSVSDNEPSNGNEGVDNLTSIERVQFSNRTLDATQPVQLFDQTNQLVGTFTTIQAGLDASQDGYTLRIAAGVFHEDITVSNGVRIIGARTSAVSGRDAANGTGETTIIGHTHVTSTAPVTFNGLRFVNDATTTGGGPSNPTLQFLTAGSGAGHTVTNSIFWSSLAGGANNVDDRAISAVAFATGTINITNNLISGSSQGLFGTASWGRGIWSDGGGDALNVSNNTIEWTRSGLTLDLAGGSLAVVSDNQLRNLGTGFSIATSEDNLTASNNHFTNVGDDYNFRNLSESVNFNAGAHGDVTLAGNANDVTVILGGSGDDFLGGTAGNDYIDANNRPGNLTVADHDALFGGAGDDILYGRYGDDTLTGGTGDDNLDGGVGTDTAMIGSGATTFSANGTNWTVSNAASGTDTLTGVEIVHAGGPHEPSTLLVGSGGFATIQEAVNASHDGDTILVASGTYVEQVVVDHHNDLTIQAAPGATVTIQAPGDLHETARSISGREINAVFTVKDSSNVVLHGIDVDGAGAGATVDENDGPGQANFYGVFYRNSSGGLVDVDVSHIRDAAFSGTQRGVGVGVDNATVMAFSMTGGSISDFQKNAAVFNGADLDFTGVHITGAGATAVIAQNGIQVTNSTGTISGNTISGLGYTGGAVTAAGVLAFGNTNLDITGNTIHGANDTTTNAAVAGIYVLDFGTPNSGGSVSGNTIDYVDQGIVVVGKVTPDGILIENNNVTHIDVTDPEAAGVYFQPDPTFATPHDVDGTAGADFLFGGAGHDSLTGLGGNDEFTGNGGDDTLAGDGGTDTAHYAGVRSGYQIVTVTDASGHVIGYSSVDDTNAGNGDEGTDTLTSIEVLTFADGTLDLGQPVQLFDENGVLVATFGTIQAAVNASHDHYTVSVAAGTYHELVTVDKDITITGPNKSIAGDGTRGSEAVVDAFYMHAAGATLNGLEVLGGGSLAGNPAGIYVDADNVTLTDLVVQGNGTAGTGILTPYGGGVTGLELSDSRIDDWTNGTYFNPTTQFTATDNSFDGNGVALTGDDWEDGTLISGNSFTNSSFGHVGYGALDAVEDVGAFFGTGNDFDATGGRPIGIFGYGTGQDISATDYADYIADTTPGGGSTFHGKGGDDYIDAGAGNDTLDGGSGNDILVGGSGTDTARYSDPVTVGNLSAVADADPETAGNQPGWTVTTASGGTDHLTGVEIVDGAGADILLVGSGGFANIQEAIDAAHDGDTILVAAGTYTEQLTVDGFTGLTIMAVPGATVIVKAPVNLDVNGNSETYGKDVHAVIAVTDSTGVNITGIDVDGSFAGDTTPGSNGDELTGIGYFNSSGAISNVDIDNVGNSQGGGLFGLQHGSGLFIDGGTTGGLTVSVNGTTITDFQKTGAIITGVTVDFSDNTITGIGGTGLTAQNGIQIFGAQGVIDHNTISGFGYTGADYAASGIIAYEPTGSLAITDNTITGATGTTTGLDLSDVEGISVQVTGNSFNGLDYGIAAYTFTGGMTGLDTDPTISGNTFSGIEVLGVYFAPEESLGAPFTTSEEFNQDGTQFADYLAGSLGDDTFNGLGGDDALTGNGGNDTLDGGAGTDTATYAGPRSDYDITVITGADGRVTGFSAVADHVPAGGDEGTDTLSSIEKLSFAGTTLNLADPVQLFDASNHLVGTFTAIQAAIDAALDDYTIRIAAGTYDEDIVVNHGLTILGAEHGIAVGGRDAAGGAGETTILGHAQVTATDNVTLDGLRFLNDTSTTAPTLQILTGGGATGHLVTNSIFWSTIAGGAGGVDDRAISTTVISSGLITITNNLISGTSQGQFGTASWGRGIWFDGGGVGLVVTGNTIEWTRTGLNLDMSGTSTANVSNNSFRGLGTGIAVGVDADGLTMLANTIERVNEEFSFRNLTTDVIFDAGAAVATVTPVGDQNDIIVVLGGSGNDTFTGTAGADVLDGNNSANTAAADNDMLNGMGGNDLLFGRGGNDTLDGGTGDDTLIGGLGNDVYIIDSAGDVITENASEGTDEIRTNLATYSLAALVNVENLTGTGNVDQTLTGNDLDNRIDGGLGADTMKGGLGNDVYIVDNVGDVVVENAGEGTDEIRTALASYSLAAMPDVENLTGTSALGQQLTGNGSANVITGAGGADTIDGGAGADTMVGGNGSDVYIVDNAGDIVTELSGAAAGLSDEVRTSLGTYVLAANVERLIGTAASAQDLRGNALDNVVISGNSGDFIRLQDGGADNVSTGAGNDAIYFGAAFTTADVVDGGTGKDVVALQGDYSFGTTLVATSLVGIETLSLLSHSDTRFGGGSATGFSYSFTTVDANVAAGQQLIVQATFLEAGEDLTFNGSAETDGSFFIYAGNGTDILTGGAGADVFFFAEDGRFGPNDHVDGGAGNDILVLRGDYHLVLGGASITNVETVTLLSGSDARFVAAGSKFNYDITTADNTVSSGQTMTFNGGGLDVGEVLKFDGSAETNGNFRIFGGRDSDTIIGGGGSDLIFGGQGADTLSGGGGADIFRYQSLSESTSTALDKILDFMSGDKIDLSRAGHFDFLGTAAFDHHAGELRVENTSGNLWLVQIDGDGDGVADFQLQVTVADNHMLGSGDFLL